MGLNALFKTLPDVSTSGLADGDLFTYQASTQKLIPITRAALGAGIGVVGGLSAVATAAYGPGATDINFTGGVLFNTGGYTVNATSISFPAGLHMVTLSCIPGNTGPNYSGLVADLAANPSMTFGLSGSGPAVAPVPVAGLATHFVLPVAEQSYLTNLAVGSTSPVSVTNSVTAVVAVTLSFRLSIILLKAA